MRRTRDGRIHVLGAAAVAVALLARPSRAEDPADKAKNEAAGYAGAQKCISCHEHEERSQDLQLTLHGKTDIKNWDGGEGCEACHGPGGAHAEHPKSVGIKNPKDLSAPERSQICLSCHEGQDHRFWEGSAHDSRNLSCLTCHEVHPKKGVKVEFLLAKGNVFDTCTSCHLRRKADMMKSAHMPVREGSMTCTSCHDAHGTNGESLLRANSVNELCYSCHAEKRSPVLWEHPPVKENCLNCHDPHGSIHPSLLIESPPRLCQQCHDGSRHPTQPYDSTQAGRFFPNSRMFEHGCVNCHPQVHGSNHPSGTRFQR